MGEIITQEVPYTGKGALLHKKVLYTGMDKKYTETSLWTNPSPSSNFAAQTVTLSDSIDKYKYIKIRYAYSATSKLDTQKYEDIRTVETFKKGTYPQTDYIPLIELGVYAGNIATARGVMYASDTTVRFSPANNIAQTGTADNRAIPLEILGLNELDHAKGFDESVLWTNSNPTASAFANQDVTLSDSLLNYDYVKFVYGYGPTALGSFSVSYKVSEFVNTSAPATYGFSGVLNVTHKSNGMFYDRRVLYKDTNTITFGSAFGYKNNGTASISNSAAIPLQIIGCKFK